MSILRNLFRIFVVVTFRLRWLLNLLDGKYVFFRNIYQNYPIKKKQIHNKSRKRPDIDDINYYNNIYINNESDTDSCSFDIYINNESDTDSCSFDHFDNNDDVGLSID